VTEKGTVHGEALGIVSAWDIMDALLGCPTAYKEAECDAE
jgi:CBS domain-containing protein